MNNTKNQIGDILVLFQKEPQALIKRSSNPWKKIAKIGEARILTTTVDEGWRGFPFSSYQDEQWRIWVLGEFYGDKHPDLRQALETSTDLNGHFLIIAYEIQAQRWHILTDRFGTLHAYLADDGKRVALGTFSPAVADVASKKQLDWGALAGFFKFGFFLGDTTYWEDVHIIEPATHLILDHQEHEVTQLKTWAWHHNPDPNLTYEDAMGAFSEQFENVVQDQVGNKTVALPISGGLDSRSTLVPLTKDNYGGAVSLFPFSYGYSADSVETEIARQLAQKRDLDIQTWTIQPYLFENIEQIMASVEGFQDISLCRQAYVVNDLSQHASHVLAAHWGDVWLDDMGFLGLNDSLSDDELANKLLSKFVKKSSQTLLQLFRESLSKDQSKQIKSIIMDDLRPLRLIKNLDFKVKAWKTQQWSFRWTLASLRMYQVGLFPLLPFYDHRLTDFFCALPSELVRDRLFQIDYLKQYAPDLARVIWQGYDANLFQYQHHQTWLLPKRVIKKFIRIMTHQKIISQNWEVQLSNPKGISGLERWLLEEGLRIHNYCERKELTMLIDQFNKTQDPSMASSVCMLLTFSVWLEMYG